MRRRERRRERGRQEEKEKRRERERRREEKREKEKEGRREGGGGREKAHKSVCPQISGFTNPNPNSFYGITPVNPLIY